MLDMIDSKKLETWVIFLSTKMGNKHKTISNYVGNLIKFENFLLQHGNVSRKYGFEINSFLNTAKW